MRRSQPRLILGSVCNEDGVVAASDEESARFLFERWRGSFAKKPVCEDAVRRITQFVNPLPRGAVPWHYSKDMMRTTIVNSKDNGPGGDGVGS